jgi:hypothetical protein
MNQHDTVGAELFNGVKREDEYFYLFLPQKHHHNNNHTHHMKEG